MHKEEQLQTNETRDGAASVKQMEQIEGQTTVSKPLYVYPLLAAGVRVNLFLALGSPAKLPSTDTEGNCFADCRRFFGCSGVLKHGRDLTLPARLLADAVYSPHPPACGHILYLEADPRYPIRILFAVTYSESLETSY